MSPYLTGLGTGLGLIVAIGAQNAWVLRQGLRREHVGVVVAVCVVGDVGLIAAGTVGIGVISSLPWVLRVLRWGGVVYLLAFALRSFRSALRPRALEGEGSAGPGRGAVALTTLGLTFLNPHVYLDTVVMLGGVVNQFGDSRWAAAAGAMTGSLLWFTSLGLGARTLSGPLARPRTWQVVDVLVGLVMVGVAIGLARGA
jgi:putative amino acid transporter